MFDPTVGRFLSIDPISFLAGDTNLYRYVGNHPTMATDPSGLAELWAWHWHHLLDQSVFNADFMTRHKLSIDINSAEYGWMLRAKDHLKPNGIHGQGWSEEWQQWIAGRERRNCTITKEMIDKKLGSMIKAYKLDELGYRAAYGYSRATQAYQAAEYLWRKGHSIMDDIASRISRRAVTRGMPAVSGGARTGAGGRSSPGRVGGRIGGGLAGALIGVTIGTAVNMAAGSENPLADALDFDPFDPSDLGNTADDVYSPRAILIVREWDNYQQELDRRAGLFTNMPGLTEQGVTLRSSPFSAPQSSPTRTSLFTGQR